MWEMIEHEGFEIWVLPILAYGPAAPGTLCHYTGYFCRHGADAHLAGQSTRFNELVTTFRNEDEARDAGYCEGRRLVEELRSDSGSSAGAKL